MIYLLSSPAPCVVHTISQDFFLAFVGGADIRAESLDVHTVLFPVGTGSVVFCPVFLLVSL